MKLLPIALTALLSAASVSATPKSSRFRKTAQGHRLATSGSTSSVVKRQVDCAGDVDALPLKADKKNIWFGLTDIEAANVTSFLFEQTALNLTVSENATSWDNSLLLVELLEPNKTDAVAYLDGDGPEPTRYAHVLINVRATTEPYYQDLMVGPLPVSNATTYAPLEYPYTRKTQGKVRNLDADSDALYTDWIYPISASVADITLDLWGGTALGLENDTLDIFGIDPLWQDDGVIRWDTFWNLPTDDFDSETLLPLGLFFLSNVTGRDLSKWTLNGWYYNGIFYNTTEDFRTAYFSEGFEKLAPNVDGVWTSTDQRGHAKPLDRKYPATVVAPAGDRFRLNKNQRLVKWMDFEFYLAFTRDTGLRLYDIKYKGKRIIYELGLQEALAHYAGSDPVQSGTSYLDSFYGFGPYSFQLISGYDCPSYATYINSSFYVDETTHQHVDSICMFEIDPGYPIQRHSTGSYVSATKNIYFTVRNVCTVGNYDYQFSYEFYMDGSILVQVRASGYIQSAYYANNGDYGYHIHDSLSGSMHDHVLNYKVDFDILGVNNTMTTVENVPASVVYPWSNGKARNTMKLKRGNVTSENDSKLNWGANSVTQFNIVNFDKRNKYGEAPGYRIQPASTVHLTVNNSSNLENAARWSEHDFFVLKQHDHEQRSAHPYNSQDVFDPPINFAKYFDGEDLTQTDLVVYFNLGMHHVPHTGDLPNTVFTTAHSAVHINPINYLLKDPSRKTVNMVRINYDEGATGGGLAGADNTTSSGPDPALSIVHTFGQADTSCVLDFVPPETNLTSYIGDVVIRKFPFDPNSPYTETDSIV